jgi:calcineurin-like phosphoesterase family protein
MQMTKTPIEKKEIIKDFAKLPQAIRQRLPVQFEDWNIVETHSGHKNNLSLKHFTRVMRSIDGAKDWKWPKRRLYIITDPHADAEAFVNSLVLGGGVKRIGKTQTEFKLTSAGRKATFIIGGDCLDKGPSNLQLLKSIRQLLDTGANVKLLAGNHDMRLFMGVHALGLKRNPATAHLFVRMGEKAVPLLLEVYATYLKGKKVSKKIPDEAECKKRLFPDADWFEQFPQIASGFMSEAAIKRELQRMLKKIDVFEQDCKKVGLTMRDVYAIALKCRQLFLHPKGEFAWFYRDMQLAYRKGSFLFIHAGLDDDIIDSICKKSVRYINRQFRQHLEKDLFHFYYGSLANTMRTKYRPADLPLTEEGVKKIQRKGLYAVVHGHLNRTQGQRIVLKQNLIHVECDITLDRGSRKKEGLKDSGLGVTIIEPHKQVIGISNDYPFVKVFEPERYL